MKKIIYISLHALQNMELFQLNRDSTFTIVQNNYFFDRFEGTTRPIEKQGALSQPEFEKFSELLRSSNIYKMKDSYGFSDDNAVGNSILYIVELTQNNQRKYVSVNAISKQNFSKEFTELIEHTNEFINANLTE